MNLLKIDAVEVKTGLHRATIFRMEAEGRFPMRRQVGLRAVRWLEREIDQWMETLPLAGRAATA